MRKLLRATALSAAVLAGLTAAGCEDSAEEEEEEEEEEAEELMEEQDPTPQGSSNENPAD
jgi:ribosomal protein L12E/L44/L45/RPP1/RPP2